MSEKIEDIEQTYKVVKEMVEQRLLEAEGISEDWEYQSGYEDGINDAMIIFIKVLRNACEE